jgi:hypothetical protein
LEAIALPRTRKHAVFRYGYVRLIPTHSGAERHMITTNTQPTMLANVEQCEFAEEVGPEPGPTPDLSFTVYLKKDEAEDYTPRS